MEKTLTYIEARERLLSVTERIETETVPLEECGGRILAEELPARENVPPFDRSPYDGYALRAADTAAASGENPVTLRILEEIPAGGVSHCPVTEGTAVKILTGAEIPPGADAVVMFEKTEFTSETVILRHPVRAGDNIVRAGEDVKKGTILAVPGMRIDPGLAGTLAGQNRTEVQVYRLPRVGVISTGHELLPVGSTPERGKILNSNQHTLCEALRSMGCIAVPLGIAEDSVEDISARLEEALGECDAVVLTGGVSVGDYDLTPAAMERAGVETLLRGVSLKPGMACAYGIGRGKPVCALSGNPASALTNFYAVAYPALRKLCGWGEPTPPLFTATLAEAFPKKSPATRLLRGTLDLTDGTVRVHISPEQGNVVLSSGIGCDVMAVVPAGSGQLDAGTQLRAFRIG